MVRQLLAALEQAAGWMSRGLEAAEPYIERVAAGTRAFSEASRPYVERATANMNLARDAVQPYAQQMFDSVQRTRAWLEQHAPEIAEVIIGMRYYAAQARVENWVELQTDDWVRALDLMRGDESVALAWVPPARVVKLLVDAPNHAARDDVLLARDHEIVAAARVVIDAVTHDKLGDLRITLEQAWDAYEQGLYRPAQAAAAGAIGEAVNVQRGENFTKLRGGLEQQRNAHPEAWALIEVRMLAVWCSVATAVEPTWNRLPGFNRHACVHGMSGEQYTQVNCLRGLMVATAAARELQFQSSREWELAGGDVREHAALVAAAQRARRTW